jgi:hypothetical protein
VCNLGIKLQGYLELSFIIATVGNFDVIWGGYFSIMFHNDNAGNWNANVENYF